MLPVNPLVIWLAEVARRFAVDHRLCGGYLAGACRSAIEGRLAEVTFVQVTRRWDSGEGK